MNILGIDAAWTETEPSGISVISSKDGINCKIISVANSYDNFMLRNQNFSKKPKGSKPQIDRFLKSIQDDGLEIDCIAIDMPLSNHVIEGRRSCETEVSKVYGSKGASTHSPTIDRPGLISLELVECARKHGYILSTSKYPISRKALIEVYPHTAIIEYLNLDYRYEYKISKKNKYKNWKNLTNEEKNKKLIENINYLITQLGERVSNIKDYLPLLSPDRSYISWYLKGYEDIIDSIVSGLVGIDYLNDRIIGYGGEDGTIWVPSV